MLKDLIHGGAALLTAMLLFPYTLLSCLFRIIPRQGTEGDFSRLNFVFPYELSGKSGGSYAIESLIEDFRGQYDLNLVDLNTLHPGGGRMLRWFGELLTVALPMPRHCRPFLLAPGAVRRRLVPGIPIFVEFVSGSLFLLSGLRPGRVPVILRDHENLCRRLAMEGRGLTGTGRLGSGLQYAACYLFLLNVYLRVRKIVTLNQADAEYIRNRFPFFARKAVYIPVSFRLPEGMDLLSPVPVAGKDLLFLANFYHRPNVDGLLWFLREVAPHLDPGLTLHLVGLAEPLEKLALESPCLRVIRHGFVDDLEGRFGTVGVAIAPIISGSGVRIKNLYLAARKKAIVTTDLGNEGIGFLHGREAIVCSDPREMAREINRLCQDPERMRELGENACRKVLTDFNRDSILARYREQVYA